MVTAAEAVFVAWFVATAIVQCRFRCAVWLRRFSGPAGLLPGWNFFSPKPIVGDVFVDARGVAADAAHEAGPWLPVVHPTPRRWFDGVLCVERRATKAVFDAAVDVVHLADAEVAPEVLITRRAYLTVLRLASAVTGPDVGLVQFRIVHISYAEGRAERRVVFESRRHRQAAT
jgi:hypothetical protein